MRLILNPGGSRSGDLNSRWKTATGFAAAALLAAAGSDSNDDCWAAGLSPYDARAFLGFRCADDCREHRAGFIHAARYSITRPLDCPGQHSRSHMEGCIAFTVMSLTPEQAGYQWAADNGVSAACLCNGPGPGFRSGCRAYLAGEDRRFPVPESPVQRVPGCYR